MSRSPKQTVFLLSSLASIFSGGLAIGIIFLFRYIEIKTHTFPIEIWGLIFILLCFSFAFFYMFGYKILENKSIQDHSHLN